MTDIIYYAACAIGFAVVYLIFTYVLQPNVS